MGEFKSFLFHEALNPAFAAHAPTSSGQTLLEQCFMGQRAQVRQCLTCGHTRSSDEELMWDMQLAFPTRFTPITSIEAVRVERVMGQSPKIEVPEGYTLIPSDCNKNRPGSPYVFLAVKRDPADTPVTELRTFVVASDSKEGPLIPEDLHMVPQDLNEGGDNRGSRVYLCFKKEIGASPITDIQVVDTSTRQVAPPGYRLDSTNLNTLGGGPSLQLAYVQNMPLRGLQVAKGGVPGHHFIDTNLALPGVRGAAEQYLSWHDAGNEAPITDHCCVP